MRIAMIGTRGIPASYSGFETCVEELSWRMAAMGHEVTVYRRAHHYPGDRATAYRGVRLVTLPTIANKYLDTLVHTTVCSLHALTQRYDAAFYFIAGNSPACWIPRLAGTHVVLNVDGLDWRRKKWPAPAKAFIKWCERIARYTANTVLTDSRVVQQFYGATYGYEPAFVPYGSEIAPLPPGEVLAKYGLTPGEYVIFVGRLVPENCVDQLLEAWAQIGSTKRCVIVGDAPYAEAYKAKLRALADDRVIFTGYVFGEGYRELVTNSYCFVETSEVGGTHPAVLEAMAMGTALIVNGTAENRETIGEAGLAYDSAAGAAALTPVLERLLGDPAERDRLAAAAKARAATEYAWDRIVEGYLALVPRR